MYKFSLPGLSLIDMLESRNKPVFWHINFTEYDIQEMIKLLRHEGILRPIMATYNNELRYEISDPQLEGFLEGCWHIYHMVYNMTDAIWTRVRKPTNDEIKWLEQLRGTKRTIEIRRSTFNERHEYSKRIKNRKVSDKAHQAIVDYNDEIKKYATNLREMYDETIKKYQFLCDELLEVIYPLFLQRLK